MKILIVEDETAAYENLADMILSLDSSIEIMGNTESVRQTVRWHVPRKGPLLRQCGHG